ncbi:MAG TPA: penicillin-binding transpeptidase domain-containing protein, partial [Acidimicrobiales bacterium]|nr:penicillin-binding transpeptidase domain-containing protein [Acidimicrobiales bacterium]
MSRRLSIFATGILILFLVVAAQALNVQFFKSKHLDASPINPRNTVGMSLYARGRIYAADGQILAESVPTTNGYSPWRRVYPLGSLTSDVVGFSSPTYGNWAIEGEYNSYLEAHAQAPQNFAQLLAPTTAADSVTLTLYPQLQGIARYMMRGQDGAEVILDPKTGAVLSMYSNPNYDPAPLESTIFATAAAAWKHDTTGDHLGFEPLANLATQADFFPGSSFKVITTATAVADKPSLLNKVYPTAVTIHLPDTNKTLSNFGLSQCGGTIAEMLPPSCDTGFALVGLDEGASLLSTMANAFGFNKTPPLDLSEKVHANFPKASTFKYNLPGVAYSAIGQENVQETALQNALVAATIANGGVQMTPHLLDYVTAPDGQVVYRYKAHKYLTPLTPTQDAQIVPLMQAVVQRGTAYGIFPSFLNAAAKTGTAQIGNAAHQLDDWLIAFAPAN